MNHDAHILIVDDDENNRFMLVQRLRQLGFQQTSEADGGDAALALIRERAPDLVLLDVMMPGTDGVNVLEVLRREGRLGDLPVLMVSAHDSIDVAARCIELGAEDYLTKPIQVAMLRARVMAVLERRRLREVERAFLTHFDIDTGLPNRHALLERVDRLLAGGGRFALVAVICREHGTMASAAGDADADASQCLQMLNRRIQGSPLPTDIVAHVGNGTLAWLLPHAGPDHLLLDEVESVLHPAADSAPAAVPLQTCSAGIAIGPPPDGREGAAGLLRLAIGEAMRNDPDAGEPVLIADPVRRAVARQSLALHRDVERALARDEMRLHFQPIVEVADHRLAGAEALLRWQHPEQGLLGPGAFLSAVENSPLMEMIDAWVLATAVRALLAWTERLPEVFKLHVNLTASSLTRARMVKEVEQTVPPSMRKHLAIELTERVHVTDMPACVSALQELRRIGVHVALDDFGTGFSSLSHISLLPCDMLKIDRSFVTRIGTDAKRRRLLGSLIAMARALGLGVVAEGIECQSELDVLRQMGSMQLQGYLLGRPMPQDEFTALLG